MLLASAGKSEKTKEARKTKTNPAKLKTTKKVPAKKAPAKLTATDQVLKIIKRSKKEVDAATLIKKTGFDDKKIRNLPFSKRDTCVT